MSENDLVLPNPLKLLGFSSDFILSKGEFGAIMARAGLGKTSLAVQLGVYTMSRRKKVLHISLEQSREKVNLWYSEVFNLLAETGQIENAASKWDAIVRNCFVMTLNPDDFTVPKLKKRLADLTLKDVFTPDTIIIDGFPFEESDRETFTDLKALADKMGLNVWFTVKTHRHELPADDGMPVQLSELTDLFSTAIQINPDGDKLTLQVLKGEADTTGTPPLFIDTETMLIKG